MGEYKKVELEFILKSSPGVLFAFLTEPSGLSEWFCDNVNIKNSIYTFIWNKDSEQSAKLLSMKENVLVKYRWLDEPDNTYFEFKIEVDDITGETALIVTDFCEEDDEEETALSWNSAMQRLHRVIGS
jgi:uncharacterized protein YndB with AHSA1/START domain